MKREIGKVYLFDSAEQTIKDVWGRPIKIKGKHTFTKVKDTLMDKIHGRSWYIVDDVLLANVGRGSYVEERCLGLKDPNDFWKGADDE